MLLYRCSERWRPNPTGRSYRNSRLKKVSVSQSRIQSTIERWARSDDDSLALPYVFYRDTVTPFRFHSIFKTYSLPVKFWGRQEDGRFVVCMKASACRMQFTCMQKVWAGICDLVAPMAIQLCPCQGSIMPWNFIQVHGASYYYTHRRYAMF